MAFDQCIGIFHQQSGAQIGQPHIGIHDQGRFIGKLENGFPAEDFGGILLGVTGKKDEAVYQAQHLARLAAQDGGGNGRMGDEPFEHLTAAGAFAERGRSRRQHPCRQILALPRHAENSHDRAATLGGAAHTGG
ncbi:MAG: hypothetical protein NTX21_00460 [Alphaproteobacteria bacterium]|nr:hypothetical protein [Alphaproteobacteria bacterium]